VRNQSGSAAQPSHSRTANTRRDAILPIV